MIYVCDITVFDKQTNMAEGEGKHLKHGGRYCVAGAPNGQSCKNTSYTPGITMHDFLKNPTVRAKWVKFIQRHRMDFAEPVVKYTLLCSVHFEQSCFENDLAWSIGLKKRRDLVKGSIPTRHTVLPEGPEVLTERKKRQVSEYFLFTLNLIQWAYSL